MVSAGLVAVLVACSKKSASGSGSGGTPEEDRGGTTTGTTIALAGNAYITQKPSGATESITANGLANWTNTETVCRGYFRLSRTGPLALGLRLKVPDGSSVINVSVGGKTFKLTVSNSSFQNIAVGTVNITDTGYVKIDLQGVSKTGGYFADVSDFIVSGAATNAGMVYASDAANYYWSRRGPSAHLGYTPPAGTNAEWFYNELTVPVGEDAIGSYFMSNGFTGGYFGIQVNSATERRVLFSVWDGDDTPTGKTTLVRKGAGVVDNAFGGEGTGGQSYLVYNWQAGATYKFLTQAKPDGAGNTVYASWFMAPDGNGWRFMAAWKRPKTSGYLTGLYSFIENFLDNNGWMGRKASYNNQWVRSAEGAWMELTRAKFTVDATARAKQRMDHAGGLDANGQFYLRNCGFFSAYTAPDQFFDRTPTGVQPAVNFSTLP